MNINEYLFQLESVINSSIIVESYELNIDRKTADIVFIAGRIDITDGSTLDFKEFVEKSDTGIENTNTVITTEKVPTSYSDMIMQLIPGQGRCVHFLITNTLGMRIS